MTPTTTTLGARIREAREAKGLSQHELAVAIGSGGGQTHVSDLERGDITSPGADTLVSLSDALDVSVDWLLGRES